MRDTNFTANMSQTNNANAASERQPRTLHSCPHPWKVGDRSCPIQLCSTTTTETHHRVILAILNRITDTNLELTIKKATELLHPVEFNEEGPSLAILREDLVSMLMEKAQDEEKYIKDYASFLAGIRENLESLPPVVRNTPADSLPRYGNLLLPLEEFVRLECVKRFEHLYGTLKTLYSQAEPWDMQKALIPRRQLITHIRFMILLHYKSLIPWDELGRVRETFARPLADIQVIMQGPAHIHLDLLEDEVFLENQVQDPNTGVNCNGLAAEMLAVFLYYFGHLNLAGRDGTRQRSEELCNILKRIMRSLPNRQMYMVLRTLDLQAKGWRRERSP